MSRPKPDRIDAVGFSERVQTDLEGIARVPAWLGIGGEDHGPVGASRVGRVELVDGHRVLGQGAGLVGRDGRHRPERLDGGQLAHDGVAVAHALGSERERQGEDRRQSLGHRGHGDGDREQQGFVEVVDAFDADPGDGQDDRECCDPAGDAVPEVLHAPLERCSFGLDGGEHGGDAAHGRLGPGSGDLDPGEASQRERAGERLLVGATIDGHGLAGEDRLVDLQWLLAGDESICRDAVAGLDPHDIAGHQQRGVEVAQLLIAHHPHVGS